MKKWLWLCIAVVLLALAACGNEEEKGSNEVKAKGESSSDTVTYTKSDGTEIEVPADPKRVVILAAYAGDVIQLGVNIVGVDSWSADNPEFKENLKDATIVSNEDVEKIIELEPDLIIGFDSIENGDKLAEIAPTVLFTYGEYDYLQQHIEIGKALNKEEEAKAWVEDFKKRAAEAGEKIKEKIGEEATITVVENYDKQMYIFGDAWGRGTEVLYQAMGLKMPKVVEEAALEPGYYAISQEVLGDYTGDYLLMSLVSDGQDTSFLEKEWFKKIDAVQKGHLIQVDARSFYFNDASSLDYQLKVLEEAFAAIPS